MNISNTVSIKQDINLNDLGLLRRADAVAKADVAAVYDTLLEKLHAFSALVEILAKSASTSLDANKLFFLILQQEASFNAVLTDLENLI